jgi:hypothetical protein
MWDQKKDSPMIYTDVLSTEMTRQEQFEIWIQSGSARWDMLGCFQDADLASSLARNHSSRSRLICVTFEHGKMISQEVVAEGTLAMA